MHSIASALGPLVTAVLVLWIASYTRREPRIVRNARVVEYGSAHKMIGSIAVIALLYVSVRWSLDYEDPFFALLLLPFLMFAAALTAHWWIAQIRFDDDTIEVISAWRRRRLIPFLAVRGVHAGMAGWKVQAGGYGSIRFNHLQRGWQRFREALDERVQR